MQLDAPKIPGFDLKGLSNRSAELVDKLNDLGLSLDTLFDQKDELDAKLKATRDELQNLERSKPKRPPKDAPDSDVKEFEAAMAAWTQSHDGLLKKANRLNRLLEQVVGKIAAVRAKMRQLSGEIPSEMQKESEELSDALQQEQERLENDAKALAQSTESLARREVREELPFLRAKYQSVEHEDTDLDFKEAIQLLQLLVERGALKGQESKVVRMGVATASGLPGVHEQEPEAVVDPEVLKGLMGSTDTNTE